MKVMEIGYSTLLLLLCVLCFTLFFGGCATNHATNTKEDLDNKAAIIKKMIEIRKQNAGKKAELEVGEERAMDVDTNGNVWILKRY